jgi:hypothetical protein
MMTFKKWFGDFDKIKVSYLLGFILVNAIFLLKYSPRMGFNPILIIGVYSLIVFFLLFFSSYLNIPKSINYICYISIFLFIISLSTFILINTDPLKINVDRWSAINNFLDYLFKGKFPYLAKTHMGQHASPFPIMHFITIPFYLMGEVGYLQVFSFIFANFVILRLSGIKKALWFNAIILISPAFWYEVSVRSDLFSNMLLVSLFIYAILHIEGLFYNSSKLIGIVSGILLCTRGIVVIPLIILYGLYFKEISIKQSLIIIICLGIGFALPLLPFALWDWELLIQYNPIILQTNKTPLILQILAMLSAIYIGYKIREKKYVSFWSFIVLLSLMIITFLMSLINYGYDETISHHNFDVAYFSISMPLIIIGFISNNFNKNHCCPVKPEIS